MELKIYLRILLRKWWIVLSVFLVTFTSTVVLTFTQAPTYEATATFIVTPTGAFEDIRSFATGLEILSRRTEIAATYAEVATSRRIREEVTDELNLTEIQRKGLSVHSQLRAGTNVLEITVEGSDPVLVRDFASTVGAKTMVYAKGLYETFSLGSLDLAELPSSPLRPKKAQNLALGSVLGLALGAGLAFLSEYLQAPLESTTGFSVIDEESGVYNKRYLKQRLSEEMSRARRNRYPLSLALMNVDQLNMIRASLSPQARSEALRKVAVFLKQGLREGDVVARVDGTVFAILLLDIPEEVARATMEKLQARIAWTTFEIEKSGSMLSLSSAAGVVAYQYNGTGQDEFLVQANRALQEAEAAGYDKVFSFSDDGETPGVIGGSRE